jgi:hypothetical protein
MELDGKRGLRAWAWIFILEGAVTVVVGKYSRIVSKFGSFYRYYF